MSDHHPHRRYNPLLDEWLIVAPQRVQRPWSGQQEKTAEKNTPKEEQEKDEKKNPLQPGGERARGIITPNYESTYVFTNDFPALIPREVTESMEDRDDEHSLFKSQAISGTCRVMCYHPRSDLTLSTMTCDDVIKVINNWQQELMELGKTYDWVQIFENKGAIVGCSNAHPHCQIWAGSFMPNQIATKHRTQREYFDRHNGRVMLLEYARQELEHRERIVCLNEHWIVVVPSLLAKSWKPQCPYFNFIPTTREVPYWAVWPFETMILPTKRHILRLWDMTDEETQQLAEIMQLLLKKYDSLFQCQMPYSMGWMGAPTGPQYLTDRANVAHWQLHAIYMPPLLRSATVKKFMAGYELVCEPQRDLTPEQAAERLRKVEMWNM